MPLAAATTFYSNPLGNWTILSTPIVSTSALTFTAAVPSGVAISNASVPPTQSPVRVDDEIMMVQNISGTTWTVVRGYGGTTAATHVGNSVVTPVPIAEVLNSSSIGALGRSLIYVDSQFVAANHGINIKPGSGVTLAGAANAALDAVDVTVTVPASSLIVQDEGLAVAVSSKLNFTGGGVSVTANGSTGAYDVSIPGLSGSGVVTGGGGVALWGP